MEIQMDNPCPTLTTEERTLGGLSYLLGALVALVIFLVEKGKSRYAPFQALQAIILSVFWMLVFSLVGGLFLLLFFLGGFATLISAAAITPTQSGPTNVLQLVPMLLPLAAQCLIFPLALLAAGINIWAFIACLLGKDFRLPLIAGMVDKFMGV